MTDQKDSICVTTGDLAIGISIVLCLTVCALAQKFGMTIQALAACTGAVMCTQDTGKASWSAGMNRLLGVICGGLVGIAVAAVDNAVQIPTVFYLLCGVGIVGNLLLCRLVKLPFIQGKVSCMSFLLVVLVLGGPMRFKYALGRFIGTLCGAVISLMVTVVFEKLGKKG